jgi:hypothetical protein
MHNRYLLETHGVPQEKIKNVGGSFEAPASVALSKGDFTYLDQLFTLWKVSSEYTKDTYKFLQVFCGF